MAPTHQKKNKTADMITRSGLRLKKYQIDLQLKEINQSYLLSDSDAQKLKSNAQKLKNHVDEFMWSITDDYQITYQDDIYTLEKRNKIKLIYRNICHHESEKDFFQEKLLRTLKVIQKEFNLVHHTYTYLSNQKWYYIIYLFQEYEERQMNRKTKKFGPGLIEYIF